MDRKQHPVKTGYNAAPHVVTTFIASFDTSFLASIVYVSTYFVARSIGSRPEKDRAHPALKPKQRHASFRPEDQYISPNTTGSPSPAPLLVPSVTSATSISGAHLIHCSIPSCHTCAQLSPILSGVTTPSTRATVVTKTSGKPCSSELSRHAADISLSNDLIATGGNRATNAANAESSPINFETSSETSPSGVRPAKPGPLDSPRLAAGRMAPTAGSGAIGAGGRVPPRSWLTLVDIESPGGNRCPLRSDSGIEEVGEKCRAARTSGFLSEAGLQPAEAGRNALPAPPSSELVVRGVESTIVRIRSLLEIANGKRHGDFVYCSRLIHSAVHDIVNLFPASTTPSTNVTMNSTINTTVPPAVATALSGLVMASQRLRDHCERISFSSTISDTAGPCDLTLRPEVNVLIHFAHEIASSAKDILTYYQKHV
ncbi:unnamed protein product [Protopolystoma xenopodis]|uniref:ARF GTPase-activating protein GIT1 C-terminal domain-containing protein n=1 Tax=Protopolystoma xenopodis TaxID=117903 RepID=A0A3S5AWJ3_9PLAT|nr:unnamed protein product [Protopolystoma xenopodis]